MNLTKKFLLFFSFIGFYELAYGVSYSAKPLCDLSTEAMNADNCVGFSYKIFTKKDCIKYLDRDVIKKGYQPIQITLTNNTNRHLKISRKNFSLATVSGDEVACACHRSVTSRVVGFSIGAIFLWPLVIPAVIEGVSGPRANDQLDSDFSQKALDTQILSPYSSINGLIFTPVESFRCDFSFTLIDTVNNERFKLSTANKFLVIGEHYAIDEKYNDNVRTIKFGEEQDEQSEPIKIRRRIRI